MPEEECIKECSDSFKQNNLLSFTKEELNKDNLFQEMGSLVQKCRQESLNTATLSINNSLFFSCSVKELSGLKDKYNYL